MSRGGQSFRVLQGAFADKLPAHRFYAYVQRGNACARRIAETDTLDAAKHSAMSLLAHKDTLLIHDVHTGRGKGFLHVYRVRQGVAVYQNNPETGLTERVRPLKLDPLFPLPVDAFEPTRPFDAFRDDATGVDRTLIEGAAK